MPTPNIPFTFPCKADTFHGTLDIPIPLGKPLQSPTMTEETGQKILSRLGDIERQMSLLLTSGVRLDGELLRIGNENETVARALMAQFDRLTGRG